MAPRSNNNVKEEEEENSSSASKDRVEWHFLSPFLVGFVAALMLIFIPTISSFVYMCGDVDLRSQEPSCPGLIIRQKEQEKERKGLFKVLLPKKRAKSEIEYLIAKQDPVEQTCRTIANSWSIMMTSGKNVDKTCAPEIVDDEEEPLSRGGGTEDGTVSHERFQTAYTPEFLELTSDQVDLVSKLGDKVIDSVDDWKTRATKVSWGGEDGPAWFAPRKTSGATELERLNGGLLLYSYLRIMKWPGNLHSHFPFKLCAKGCNSEVALAHSLEFREKFKPWAVTPSTMKENSNGSIFHHGFSPAFNEGENGQHSLVWIRPGRRVKVDDIFTTRAYVNALEQAVTASLVNSGGRVGKFNVVLDGHNFSWGLMPSLHQLKVFITILQDHFPDRLGIILLTNLGRVGEFVVGVVKPIISEEVRNKIVVLPREEKLRREMLQAVVGTANIPKWLGGRDPFEFDVNTYYSNSQVISDEESKEYTKMMPYHT